MRIKFSGNSIKIWKFFFQETVFKNAIWEMPAIVFSSLAQDVNASQT